MGGKYGGFSFIANTAAFGWLFHTNILTEIYNGWQTVPQACPGKTVSFVKTLLHHKKNSMTLKNFTSPAIICQIIDVLAIKQAPKSTPLHILFKKDSSRAKPNRNKKRRNPVIQPNIKIMDP